MMEGEDMKLYLGLDVGSTTVKIAVLNEELELIYSEYKRHKSDVKKTVESVLLDFYSKYGDIDVCINVTGSGGMFAEKYLGITFVQEVIAGSTAIKHYIPDTDVIIELGGEDSKITYLSGNVEQRMNSICAGGTGAFIDQMASLLNTDAAHLNELAYDYEKIYPIASRCGVFAKTDIQALLNQGASREDIAMSVFQSVVNQTISNLACGRPIVGNITFLGGPLHYLDNLVFRFKETLGEERNTFYRPDDAKIFVAKGAALLARKEGKVFKIKDVLDKFDKFSIDEDDKLVSLEALFKSEAQYEEFVEDHKSKELVYKNLADYQGPIYLGIDSGSTTSKIVAVGENEEILFENYQTNKGKPLEIVMDNLKSVYGQMNPKAYIASSGITGYGEDFIKAALNIDTGEVETIAHYTAAKRFDPNVDFILDIGGQDMKAMHVKDGVIDSIQLNEACSSGCGSFLQTFAASVGMSVEEFQKAALYAQHPVDLGSRCTVFMNSRVKQAQKEGAGVGDIAAGLCYSVILNAINKVIKVRDPEKLGNNLVVQGGTFYGDAILKAFENITGKKASRPSIAGLMGAYGMALIAKERSKDKSSILSKEELSEFSYTQKSANCGKCTNNCSLQVNIFSDGRRYITGNRCERGAGINIEKKEIPNLYRFKYERLFSYEPLADAEAFRGTVGIPRVLNMYENYPFWHTFFSQLGFRVVLSDKSSRKIYEKGLSSISSETACYPAKLVNGHIENLVEKGLKFIFYPSIFYESKQFDKAHNQLNCPVVAGYPEVVVNNVDSLSTDEITYLNPFLSFSNEKILYTRLSEVFRDIVVEDKHIQIPKSDIKRAVKLAWREQNFYHEDIAEKGKEALEYIDKNNAKAIVLAGRPYHVDPEINHGIPELIESMDIAVISEDALAYNIEDISGDVRVLDQWVYHSRLYRAAEFVGKSKNIEMIQLNSFGCGLDAVTTDQVNDILNSYGKIYTVLKIDEVSNLGAAKIRIRSLVQAMADKPCEEIKFEAKPTVKLEYTKEMRTERTVLVPAMAPDHFRILKPAIASEGYKLEFLEEVDRGVINDGLKYVNNDSCYPSITVVGQMLHALTSGKYDPDKTVLAMFQTGGACRASNYVGYIRKALSDAGYPQVPVLAISVQGIESNGGFTVTYPMIRKSMAAIVLGDLIVRVSNRMRPYEVVKGTTNDLKEKWLSKLENEIPTMKRADYEKYVYQIVEEFDGIEVEKGLQKPKVGIVGEILVKYLPAANNHLQDILEEEGAEVISSDLTDFLLYCVRNTRYKAKLYGKNRLFGTVSDFGRVYLEYLRKPIRKALRASENFEEPKTIEEIEDYAKEVVQLGHHYGEGWLLTGEMVELINQGAPNIVCVQPFGCLPNHITGKGMIKAVRNLYPQANIIAVDYDPGASEVNQVNRIKLMMAIAKEKIKEN